MENSEKCYESLKLFRTLFFIINSLRHVMVNMVLKCEIFKILLSNIKRQFFHIFQNISLKYSSLYTNLPNYSKTFISKIIQQNFFRRKGYLWDSWSWHKNLQFYKFIRILSKWQKTEKVLFSLFDNPTLNANFKWQPCWMESRFDFDKNMKILISLKIPLLILSTILDLMLVFALVNYFGNQVKQVILYS